VASLVREINLGIGLNAELKQYPGALHYGTLIVMYVTYY